MDIRIAKDEKDSIAVSYIHAMGWKTGYKHIYSEQLLSNITETHWVSACNSSYSKSSFAFAIMRVDDEDIGAGSYGICEECPDGSVGEIRSMYFLEKAWGKGYSKQLMDFMMQKLRQSGCREIRLWTLKENFRAQRFYEKYGFRKTGNEMPWNTRHGNEPKTAIEYVL